MIDLHCDTISVLHHHIKPLEKNDFHVDIQKLKKANSSAQFFALFLSKKSYKDDEAVTEAFRGQLRTFKNQMKLNQQWIEHVRNFTELEQVNQSGKIGAFLTIEEGAAIADSLDLLQDFYDEGVRLMTLTWNFENYIGYPNAISKFRDEGLKPFGFDVIHRMNELGMLIDVSHLSDGGFYDVAKYSRRPFVASHSNARAIKNHSRNLTDDMIRVIGNTGGVIGINYLNIFLSEHEESRIEDIIRHMDHIINVGGIDCLALGSDFDGIDCPLEISNIGETYKLSDVLIKKGYSDTMIEKIFEKNAKRVIRDVLI